MRYAIVSSKEQLFVIQDLTINSYIRVDSSDFLRIMNVFVFNESTSFSKEAANEFLEILKANGKEKEFKISTYEEAKLEWEKWTNEL